MTAGAADPTISDAELLASFVELGRIVAVLALIAFLVVFGAMLLRASRYAWPVPIIAPIAMLTLIFGVAGLVNTELVPLAGAGLGALAGVLTAQLGRRADDPGTPAVPDEAVRDTPSPELPDPGPDPLP